LRADSRPYSPNIERVDEVVTRTSHARAFKLGRAMSIMRRMPILALPRTKARRIIQALKARLVRPVLGSHRSDWMGGDRWDEGTEVQQLRFRSVRPRFSSGFKDVSFPPRPAAGPDGAVFSLKHKQPFIRNSSKTFRPGWGGARHGANLKSFVDTRRRAFLKKRARAAVISRFNRDAKQTKRRVRSILKNQNVLLDAAATSLAVGLFSLTFNRLLRAAVRRFKKTNLGPALTGLKRVARTGRKKLVTRLAATNHLQFKTVVRYASSLAVQYIYSAAGATYENPHSPFASKTHMV